MYDIEKCQIELTKHFRNKYMRRWNWDMNYLREAIRIAYKVEKVGKNKFEIYTRKGGKSRKIICVYDYDEDTLYIISGGEGK